MWLHRWLLALPCVLGGAGAWPPESPPLTSGAIPSNASESNTTLLQPNATLDDATAVEDEALLRQCELWIPAAYVHQAALPIDQDLFDPITIDGVEAGELRRNWFPYTMPFNITGHPALSLCNGYDSEGLPTSLQIVGRFRDEASVLRAAALYEASESWLDRWPDL